MKNRVYTEVRTNFEKFCRGQEQSGQILSRQKVPFQDQGSSTIARGPAAVAETERELTTAVSGSELNGTQELITLSSAASSWSRVIQTPGH